MVALALVWAWAAAGGEVVVVRAGRVIPVVGDPIDGGVIVIRDGVIQAVGREVEVPAGARVVEAADATVLPGLIDPYATAGLVRSRGGVSGTANRADALAVHELRPVDEDLARMVRAGYTLLGLYPSDGPISGRMVVVRPAGPLEQRIVVREGPMRAGVVPRTQVKQVVREAFAQARRAVQEERARAGAGAQGAAPAQGAGPPQGQESTPQQRSEPDEKTRLLMAVLKGEMRLVAEAPSAASVVHLLECLGERPAEMRWALAAGAGTWRAARHLGGVVVILRPRLEFVPFTRDRVNPARELERAGARVVLSPMDPEPAAHGEIWSALAELVRAGLPRSVALEAVTVRAAEVLGVEERFGSIQPGREGDLVFLSGDPFDPTSRLVRVMIRGDIVHEAEAP